MKNFDMKKINQAGSLMIEAIAMLGLISLVTPVVYKKSAERMTELQDINAASHMRMLSSALDAYISDNYDTLKSELGETAEEKVSSLDADKLVKYLPEGAVEGGKVYGPLGEDYKFSYVIKKTDNPKAPVITGYVGADVTDDKITPQRTSRIATMIGGNGAIVDNGEVLGVQGTWQTTPDSIKLDGISDNSVVVASQNAVGATAQIDTSKFLYRVEDDVENNTMQTNLYMWGDNGANSIEGVSQLLIGYQAGRDGNTKGTADTNSLANYGLYVNGIDSNTWLGGSLEAAQGKLSATETTFKYNPYTSTTGEGNTTAVAGAGLVVDNNKDNGMSFSVAGNDNDKFKVNNNQLTYASNLIVAENGAGDTTKQAVRFFASNTTSSGNTTDTSAATFTKDEARFLGETDGPKVSITRAGTTIKNQLVAMNPKNYVGTQNNKATYDESSGFKDKYALIGNKDSSNKAVYTPYEVAASNAKNANILSGRTIATQLETGYLKSDNFDTKSLRAGRNNLNESQEPWNLDVNEKGVKIGYKRKASNKAGDLPTNYAYINVASGGDLTNARQVTSYNEDGTETLKQGTIQLKTGGQGSSNYPISQLDIGRIYKDDGKTVKNVGGIAMTVSDANIENKVTNGQINLRTVNTSQNPVTGRPPITADNASLVMRSTASNAEYDIEMNALRDNGRILIQAGKLPPVNTGKEEVGSKKSYNGTVEIESENLLVKNKVSTSSDTADAWVYIRKGAIDLKTDENQESLAADAGTGYVKADRFVVENTKDNGHERDPNEVYKDKTIGQGVRYDHYMVDPAYTSVMHDIKLTSRGGARLSDILPDFINKGIYVTDNSYGEGTTPKESGISSMNDSVNENTNAIFASAFLGVVPAPQCPPGYAKVITLTPAGWRMAQIGTLVEDSSANAGNRLYLNESTPMYGDTGKDSDTKIYDMTSKGLIKGDIKEIPAGGGSITIPRIFQQNTWLKSAIKLNLGGNVAEDKDKGNENSTGGQFVGWNTYMGFIYPSVLWDHLIDEEKYHPGMGGVNADQLGQGSDNKIYWNLFPVDKWSIEGYATVYCYFDRNGLTNNGNSYFNEYMVDTEYNQYSKLREVGQGVKRNNDNHYIDRLNNPKLKYKQEW